MRVKVVAWAVALVVVGVNAAWGAGVATDSAALVAAAERTRRDLATRPAEWTVITRAAGGVTGVKVDVFQAGDRRRVTFSIKVNGADQELARIVERDGVWYVTESGSRGKYRPYEYPFEVTQLSVFYERAASLILVVPEIAGTLGAPVLVEGDVATYVQPVDAATRQRLEGVLRQAAELLPTMSQQQEEQTRQMRELLRDGVRVKVDVANGILRTFGSPKLVSEVVSFRWLEGAVAESEFAVGDGKWEDHTSDLTRGDLSQLAMIGNFAKWEPGMPKVDPDGRLVDLATGTMRRIPFHGEEVMVGCFVDDRRGVVVVGIDSAVGTMGLYGIDLRTGENRPLGTDVLAGRLPFLPVLSPDGKTVAVARVDLGRAMLKSQICLIDLATGRGREVGEEIDASSISWTPDGRGLVLERKEPAVPPKGVQPRTIVRMDVSSGRVEVVRAAGSMPVVMGDGRILFQDDADAKQWKTCNERGEDARLFAGGMGFGCAFPSVGPDGKSVFFMRLSTGEAPRPVVVRGDGTVTVPPLGPGLWVMPGWR